MVHSFGFGFGFSFGFGFGFSFGFGAELTSHDEKALILHIFDHFDGRRCVPSSSCEAESPHGDDWLALLVAPKDFIVQNMENCLNLNHN